MTLSDATILVVDDEPVLQLTFSILLEQAGAKVITASNGAEALEALEHIHADVILTDKQMPGMDGLTMLKELRHRGDRTPAIFFVNGVASENPAVMERLGVAEMVTKPLHPNELKRVLTRVLEAIPSRN